MAKMKVYELARDLGVQSNDILTVLKNKGIEVKSHMSVLDDGQVQDVKNSMKAPAKSPEEPKAQDAAASAADKKERPAAAKAPVKKKKSIIFVSNPENSKMPGKQIPRKPVHTEKKAEPPKPPVKPAAQPAKPAEVKPETPAARTEPAPKSEAAPKTAPAAETRSAQAAPKSVKSEQPATRPNNDNNNQRRDNNGPRRDGERRDGERRDRDGRQSGRDNNGSRDNNQRRDNNGPRRDGQGGNRQGGRDNNNNRDGRRSYDNNNRQGGRPGQGFGGGRFDKDKDDSRSGGRGGFAGKQSGGRGGKGSFVPGRFAMTCCVQDIQFVGFPCSYDGYKALEQRSWVKVTARVNYKFHNIYRGKGPVLSATSVVPAQKPLNDVVTFS